MLLNNQFRYHPTSDIAVFGNSSSNAGLTSIQERIDSISKELMGKEQVTAYLKVLEVMQIIKVVALEKDGFIDYEVLPDVDETSE